MSRRFAVILTLAALVVAVTGCSAGAVSPTPGGTASTPTGGAGGGAIVQSDSIIIGEIKAIRSQSTGYPWEVDVLVKSSADVGNLPNPTREKIGQVITAKTDEDMKSFTAGQNITAKVKLTGDVPLPGISLYIYNVKAE